MRTMQTTTNLHERAWRALMTADPAEKCAAVTALAEDFAAGRARVVVDEDLLAPCLVPGRPERPELVPPRETVRRGVGTREGHAALLHAIAHIEFNAINLALDCVARFRSLPVDFHAGWLRVAEEEALHYRMVCERLHALGTRYGDYSAHDGLWEMACKTAGDLVARMALVPRVLEARGLDATPPIIARLEQIGDVASVAVLRRILIDEAGHVALGDRWFRWACAQRGLEPEATYLALIEQHCAPLPQLPMNLAARRAAGFSDGELQALQERALAARDARTKQKGG